jgi:hypothetical protein
MDEEITAIGILNDETKVGCIIKELQPTCLFLWQVLNLTNDMLRVSSIGLFCVLRELLRHLFKNILSRLLIIKSLSWNENWWCASIVSLLLHSLALRLLAIWQHHWSWLIHVSSIVILLLVLWVGTHIIIAFLRWDTNIRRNAIHHLNLWGLLSSHHLSGNITARSHLMLRPCLEHMDWIVHWIIDLSIILLECHAWLLNHLRINPLNLVVLRTDYTLAFILLIWILRRWILRCRII